MKWEFENKFLQLSYWIDECDGVKVYVIAWYDGLNRFGGSGIVETENGEISAAVTEGELYKTVSLILSDYRKAYRRYMLGGK